MTDSKTISPMILQQTIAVFGLLFLILPIYTKPFTFMLIYTDIVITFNTNKRKKLDIKILIILVFSVVDCDFVS